MGGKATSFLLGYWRRKGRTPVCSMLRIMPITRSCGLSTAKQIHSQNGFYLFFLIRLNQGSSLIMPQNSHWLSRMPFNYVSRKVGNCNVVVFDLPAASNAIVCSIYVRRLSESRKGILHCRGCTSALVVTVWSQGLFSWGLHKDQAYPPCYLMPTRNYLRGPSRV